MNRISPRNREGFRSESIQKGVQRGAVPKVRGSHFRERGKCESIGGMKIKQSEATFKAYTQNQLMLSTNLDELIPEKHLVRVVNEVIDVMDLEILRINTKEGERAVTIRG